MGKRANNEGSIYRRKSDGKWIASISLENGQRKVFYGKTQKEVKDKLARARNEQQQGTLITAPQQTLEQFLHGWLENTQRDSIRPRSYERYEEIIRLHIVPLLGRIQLQKLTAQNVQSFYAQKRKEGLSPTTITLFHGILHKALDCAVKWNLVPRNVCELVSPPRREDYEIHPLTAMQVKKLLEVAQGHDMEALFCLAIVTGMRRGELMALKWQDVDFSANTLHVHRNLSRIPSKMAADKGKGYEEAEPKTKQSRRSIVIASFAIDVLQRHHQRQLEARQKAGPAWQEHDYVFCTSVGTHLHPTRILNQFKALLQKADLPEIRFHDLRHSAATLLLMQREHPKVVQEILGHSDIAMTMDIYSHVLPSMHEDAMRRLQETLGKQNKADDDENDENPGSGALVRV